ncbi:unnamed protein product [Owenia fusiformis]|uniref:Beta-lactamase-related domain-containing protein n=1 Tax=Owenia fusiformis TaxID=6347 RepID=A0A8S4PYM4_OWEFU|nr:unnamed protein product [Owenia fusiformis]
MIIWLFIVACLLLQGEILGQQLSPGDRKRIDDFLNEAMRCQRYTGLSVSVVRGGEAVFTKGYGMAVYYGENSTENIPVTADTVFPIASISKHMTASIIGHVLQNTSYTWDTPYTQMIRELFNEDIYLNDFWRTEKASLRDMLSHRMGIAGHDVIRYGNQWSKRELVERIRFISPRAEFRNSYWYNNILYSVASYVAERHAGKEWGELLRDNFFTKLGMANASTFKLGHAANFSGWALPHETYVRNELGIHFGPIPMSLFDDYITGPSGPAGGAATSAKDMAMWMNFQLNYDKEPYVSILNPEITKQIRRGVWARGPQNRDNTKPRNDFSFGSSSYGMGIGNGYWRGHPVLSHGGSLTVYTSDYAILPYLNMGVFVASNQPASYLSEIRMFIFDVLLGIENPYINISRLCSREFESDMVDLEEEDDDAGLRYAIESIVNLIDTEKLDEIKSKLINRSPMANELEPYQSNQNAYALAKAITAIGRKIPRNAERNSSLVKEFSKYTGTYGNFAYGNCTVRLQPNTSLFDSQLELSYGWMTFSLKRDNATLPNVFTMTVLELYEYNSEKVVFSSSKNNDVIDQIHLSFDTWDRPYLWVRNRKFSDAPPPGRRECPTPVPPVPCPTRRSSGSRNEAINLVGVLTFIVILLGI